MLAGVDLVLLDFDGVVVDSEPISLATLRTTLADAGIEMEADEVRRAFLGKSLVSIQSFLNARQVRWTSQDFAAAWEARLFTQFRQELRAIPHVTDFLDHLTAQGIRYCVASSGTLKRINLALDVTGLNARFPNIFSAEHVAQGKPAPDLFLHAAREMGVPSDRCLVIEDSLSGVQAAKSAQMRCFAFLGGSHLAASAPEHGAEMMSLGAETVFDDFRTLF
jgi:HAD superfamily hydrolase (TIGR01509 family)